MTPNSIGWVAKESGVKIQTVLYYERRGLLPKPLRTTNGYRIFDDESVRRIRFIRRAKELGFSLKQIGGLLDLQEESGATCSDVSAAAQEHSEEIAKKISDLKRIKKNLEPLLASCPGKGPLARCSILNSFKGDD